MSLWQNQFVWGRSDTLATGEILRFCVVSTSGKCDVHVCVMRWVGQKAHPYLKSLSPLFNSSVQLAKDCSMQVSRKLCSPCLFHPMSSPVPPALARTGHDSAPSAFPHHIMGGTEGLAAGQEKSPHFPNLAVISAAHPSLVEALASSRSLLEKLMPSCASHNAL